MRNYELRFIATNQSVMAGLFFQNREAARFAKNTQSNPSAFKISRGPDHPYVPASKDKGSHRRPKSKAKIKAFS